MAKGYWKLVEEADGWDIHQDKYEWVEEVEEEDKWGYKTGRTVEKDTGEYSYRTPRWLKEQRGW